MAKHPQLIQSYVKRKWLVSTGYRESSVCMDPPPCYYETIIWEWDPKTGELGRMLNVRDSGGCEEHALKDHFGIVVRLSKSEPELEPEDIRMDWEAIK